MAGAGHEKRLSVQITEMGHLGTQVTKRAGHLRIRAEKQVRRLRTHANEQAGHLRTAEQVAHMPARMTGVVHEHMQITTTKHTARKKTLVTYRAAVAIIGLIISMTRWDVQQTYAVK